MCRKVCPSFSFLGCILMAMATVGSEPLPDPSKFAPRDGENEKLAARRRNADVQAEYNAVTCVAIYMLVMQFSQKGIDELRKYQEHMEMRHPEGDFVLSEGFDEGAPLTLCTLSRLRNEEF